MPEKLGNSTHMDRHFRHSRLWHFSFSTGANQGPREQFDPAFWCHKEKSAFWKIGVSQKGNARPFKLWSKQTHSSFTPQVTPKKMAPSTTYVYPAEYLDRVEALANIFLSVPTAEVSKIAGENVALGCRDRMEIGDNQHLQRRTSVESLSLLGYHPVSMSSVILGKEEEIGD